EDGGGEGRDRSESRVSGEEGVAVWDDIHSGTNNRLAEGDLLGAVVGRDGAYLLLSHFHLLHGWLCLLHQDVEGALLRGFLSKQKRLMKARNFDLTRFNELSQACLLSPPLSEFTSPSRVGHRSGL
ncbi:hypothetical protein BHM03_00059867, partial [Ensete ventricosum]